MKLKKRKIKYSAIFFICWFALLVILVDGVLKFQTLVEYFGSYALVEITLLLLVILGAPDKPCGGCADASPKTCCQTEHKCKKVSAFAP